MELLYNRKKKKDLAHTLLCVCVLVTLPYPYSLSLSQLITTKW